MFKPPEITLSKVPNAKLSQLGSWVCELNSLLARLRKLGFSKCHPGWTLFTSMTSPALLPLLSFPFSVFLLPSM
jgi:hypothetical protein